ncbi:MAG TPA: ABC transporter ATP-binding protein [Gammaproteobacteria bacterium]|nr:ABC transporter ATP-binding protein [Gammaproteobacteria bacterium]
MNAAPLIRTEQLTKHYDTAAGQLVALHGVAVNVFPGEFVAIMGPSGSGKTTFMNLLGCLDVPSSGEYYLQGKAVAQLDHDQLAHIRNQLIGFVFQGYNLLPRLTAWENVALPLVYAGWERTRRVRRANEMLERLGLVRFADFYPNQLSGGQQQRVAIARALANHAALILADEPTGNLDTATSDEIMTLFGELSHGDGITIVLVTHEPDIARYARRLIRFRDGQVLDDAPHGAAVPS